jgi:predicted metalloprotease
MVAIKLLRVAVPETASNRTHDLRENDAMEWTPGGTSSDIEDRRGDSGGGGGGFNLGGGGGVGVVGFIVIVVFGLISGRGFIGSLLGGLSGAAGGGVPMQQQRPRQSSGPVQESAAEHRDVQLVSFVLDDAQKTWTAILPQQTGRNYRRAKLVLFRGETQSGCGDAQSSTGPFYCPQDERVYIDLGFWDELKRLGGNSGEFAQAYVITHELGHHVQNILGTEAKVQQAMRNPATRSKASVELELQADCYAGIWAHSTQQRGILEGGDIDQALQNAAAVGDDHIQKMQRGTVSPESFTHGSSAERQGWFKRGFTTGQVSACNTFAAGPDGYGG